MLVLLPRLHSSKRSRSLDFPFAIQEREQPTEPRQASVSGSMNAWPGYSFFHS